ncbi:hypothetical protein PTSG_10695 [Salpingoeca rosetta]|uniref:Uncharacterized protein n=1 Tax=Salpingoeca rosetta (strain ATCC 50818 / BSB-021) TaxID=946362 RepID=F2UQ42_SALR5|nr:uncharacterized protein PTSG_10695 [Salpingoeca rosetta]EGD79710.1 hypothetical protein PTSG_10695 [Salpingoeca rosetta]|eukprot:XP_004988660.1 hypothetical protein PTSG_10695 [Salpingoeca rosetta]
MAAHSVVCCTSRVCRFALVVLLLHCWSAVLLRGAVIEEDGFGNLHITTTTTTTTATGIAEEDQEEWSPSSSHSRVLVNGVDVMAQLVAAQRQLRSRGRFVKQLCRDHTVDVTTVTGLGQEGLGKWRNSVLAPNGKVYAMPIRSPHVLIVDPDTNAVDTTTITGFSTGQAKWTGAVLAPNNKIYAVPADATSVLIIDPATNAYNASAITGLPPGDSKWADAVLASNGLIFGMPNQAASVLIIDPATNASDTTTIPVAVLEGGNQWYGAVQAPNNGKIYAAPGMQTAVLIIDPATNTTDNTTIAGFPLSARGHLKWRGAVLAPNGKIYCVPQDATSVLIIDPFTDTADTTTLGGLFPTTSKWYSGVLTPDGRILGIPDHANAVLIIDPIANTTDVTSLRVPPNQFGWATGLVAGRNRDKVVCVPYGHQAVLIIDLVCLEYAV